MNRLIPILAVAAALLAAAVAASATPASAAAPAASLAPVKSYLLQHTALLTGFTKDFSVVANRYYAAAKRANFSYPALAKNAAARRDLARAKTLWIKGNPYYERVEGIVAGTPSLAVYDVILDAGSSAKEDPASAVPFDLKLPNGKVLPRPGNLYNLTEGMLWGRAPSSSAGGPTSTATAGSRSARCCRTRTRSRPQRTPSCSIRGSSTAPARRGGRPRPTRSPPSS